MTYITHSPAETEAVGKELALSLLEKKQTNMEILLYGDLGVGKTAFTRGFCSAFGFSRVKSPTYTVVNEYPTKDATVFHFDLYRLGGPEDLDGIGYEDYLAMPGIKILEWSERLQDQRPERYIEVRISHTEQTDEREIQIISHF